MYESDKFRAQLKRWKNGERTIDLKAALVKVYGRYKSGEQYLKEETAEYLKKHIYHGLKENLPVNFSDCIRQVFKTRKR